jgi:hypothetical protein
MSEVFKISVQTRRPDGDDPGAVTEGAYIVDDGVLTMTQPDGSPVRNPERFTHKLRDGDNAPGIAGQLTLEIRQALLGKGTVAGFNRQLAYPKSGVA